ADSYPLSLHDALPISELHIGAADRAGDQRHRVGVQRLLGLHRAELEDRLQAVADLGGIEFALLGMGRKTEREDDGGNGRSKKTRSEEHTSELQSHLNL